MGSMFVVLHYYKLIGRNNYPLLLVLILNLVLGVLILFVCKRDIADISRTPSHCDNIIDIQFMSVQMNSWPDIPDIHSIHIYISSYYSLVWSPPISVLTRVTEQTRLFLSLPRTS